MSLTNGQHLTQLEFEFSGYYVTNYSLSSTIYMNYYESRCQIVFGSGGFACATRGGACNA